MQLLIQRMSRHISGRGFLSEIPHTIVAEGCSQQLTRSDQSVDETEFTRAFGEFQIRNDEMDSLTPMDVIQRVDAAAQQMRDQIERMFFKTVDDTTKKTGNVLNAKGPVTPERVMEMLNMLQIDFRRDGKFNYSIVCGPEMFQQIQKAFADIESDPALGEQLEAIIARKREEWNAREAARKLVG